MSERDNTNERKLVPAGGREVAKCSIPNSLLLRGIADLERIQSENASNEISKDKLYWRSPPLAVWRSLERLRDKVAKAPWNRVEDLPLKNELDSKEEAWANLLLATEKKDPSDTTKDLDQIIAQNPTFGWAFIARAHAFQNRKNYDKAIGDLEQAVKLVYKNKHALAYCHILRGLAWLKKKDCDRAIMEFEQAISFCRNEAWAFANRGVAWLHKKEFGKAIDDFDEAVRLHPENGSKMISDQVKDILKSLSNDERQKLFLRYGLNS